MSLNLCVFLTLFSQHKLTVFTIHQIQYVTITIYLALVATWYHGMCDYFYSPSGKLVQIEYALAAVAAGAPSVGIKGE